MMRHSRRWGRFFVRCALSLMGVGPGLMTPAQAQTQTLVPSAFIGDFGLGIYRIDPIAGTDAASTPFPYVYGDLGRWYARVDTFGYKAMPLAYGHLELSARISFEGDRPKQATLPRRESPRLLGVGTFQETPVGGFFLYAFHDIVSGGAMLDATYAAEMHWRGLTVYPELGFSRRSARYVDHLYGVTQSQANQASVQAYQAGSSTVPNAGWAMEWSWGADYKVVGEFKRRWLDRSITQSPLVLRTTQNSAMLALVKVY